MDKALQEKLIEMEGVVGLTHELTSSSGKAGFSAKEVAQMLGVSIDVVRDAIRSGTMPAWRLGTRVVIPRSAIEYGPQGHGRSQAGPVPNRP